MSLLQQQVFPILGLSLEHIDNSLLKNGLDNVKTLEFPLAIIIVLSIYLETQETFENGI